MAYYPDINDPEFYNKLNSKQEFAENTRKIKPFEDEYTGYKDKGVYQEPYQQFVKKYINPKTPYDSLLLFWELGTGKCFSGDTDVLMCDGTVKNIKNIIPGDLVMGDDFSPRTVMETHSGTACMYKITNLSTNDSYNVKYDHVLVLKDKFGDIHEIPANEYNNNLCMKGIKKFVSDQEIFNEIEKYVKTYGEYIDLNSTCLKKYKYLCDTIGVFYTINDIYNHMRIDINKKQPSEYDIKVEYYNSDMYYGFSLSGIFTNKRFLLADRDVVHNSNGAISILSNFLPYVGKEKGMEKFLIITKNDSLKDIFIDEIIKDPYSPYINEEERESLKKGGKILRRLIERKINADYEFINYETFTNRVIGRTITVKEVNFRRREMASAGGISFDNRIIVIDEIQNVTGNFRYIALMKLLRESINAKLILLSATPMSDSVDEIIYVSNLLNWKNPIFDFNIDDLELTQSSDKQLKERIRSFPNIFTTINNILSFSDNGLNLLKKSLIGKVSFVPANPSTFPERIWEGEPITERPGSVRVVKCVMSPEQTRIYDSTSSDSSPFQSARSNAATFAGDSNNPNHLTTYLHVYGIKIHNILEKIRNDKGIHFVYSNNVTNSGTKLIAQVLDMNGFVPYNEENKNKSEPKYALFHHEMKDSERQEFKNIINTPENNNGDIIKVIIGSPMISEGVTFLNVRHIHILEPYWNLTRTLQAEARCIRNYSHFSLPENERNVRTYWYCAVRSDNSPTIDFRKYYICEVKHRHIKRVEREIKKLSIDCYNLKHIKEHEGYKQQVDYSMDCDYEKCDYQCDNIDENKIEKPANIDTYDDTSDPVQISISKQRIMNIFNKGNIWDVKGIMELPEFRTISVYNIYYALDELVSNKIKFTANGMSGYIVQNDDYYIFKEELEEEKFTMIPIRYEDEILQEITEDDIEKPSIDQLFKGKKKGPSIQIKDSDSVTSSMYELGPSGTSGLTSDMQQLTLASTEYATSEAPSVISSVSTVYSKRAKEDTIKRSNTILDFKEKIGKEVFGIIEDNKFKVVDMRGKDITNLRSIPKGQQCSTIKVDNINSIFEYYNIPFESGTREAKCRKLLQYLSENNYILRL